MSCGNMHQLRNEVIEMYKIQTLNKISEIGTDIFDKSRYSVADDCSNPDAIMVRSAKMHDMTFGDNCQDTTRTK